MLVNHLRWILPVFSGMVLALLVLYAAMGFDNALAGFLLVLLLGASVLAIPLVLRIAVRRFAWWKGMWFLLFMSSLVFRMREANEIAQDPIDAAALYRIVCVGVVGLGLFLLLSLRTVRWLRPLLSGIIGLMGAFVAISLLSTVWSVSPAWTFYKSIEVLIDLAALATTILVLPSIGEYRAFMNWSWILLGALAFSAWVGALFFPSEGLVRAQSPDFGLLSFRLEGVLPGIDANAIGEICVILMLLSICRIWRISTDQPVTPWYKALFAVSFITLIFSQTRADFLAFAVGLIVLLLITRRYGTAVMLGAGTVLVASALLLVTNVGETASTLALRGQSVDSAEGLSGRVDLWNVGLEEFAKRPLTGYGGFAGARFVTIPAVPLQTGASDALNSYVDSMLDIGIAGPLLLLSVLIIAAVRLAKSARNPQVENSERFLALEALLVLAVIAVRSMVSGNLVRHPMLAFLAVIGCAEICRRQALQRTQQAQEVLS